MSQKRKNSTPARTRYNAEKRWEVNKLKKQEKHKKRVEKKAQRKKDRENTESMS